MSDNEDSQMDDGASHNAEDLGAPPEGYNDTNRAFLQAFMSRGSLNFQEGQSILAAILSAAQGQTGSVAPESITRDVFNNYVQTAHEILLPLDLDIRSTRHQKTKERVWALVNVESDLVTQLATVHTPEEIAYINRLLDLMFEKFNTPRMEVMAVEENECFRISKPARPPRESNGAGDETQTQGGDKGLKHSDILTLLANLVAEGWLEKSRAGYYSLTPRSLMELKSWLVETYNDNEAQEGGEDSQELWQPIKFCEFCKEVVTVGQRCPDPDCLTRIHDICQRPYWESRPDKKCPRCETEWSGKLYVGERAVTATEAYGRSRRKSKGGSRRRQQEDTEEEQGDEELEE